jgi:hypothetical protein
MKKLKVVKNCGGKKRGCGSKFISTWETMIAKTFETVKKAA